MQSDLFICLFWDRLFTFLACLSTFSSYYTNRLFVKLVHPAKEEIEKPEEIIRDKRETTATTEHADTGDLALKFQKFHKMRGNVIFARIRSRFISSVKLFVAYFRTFRVKRQTSEPSDDDPVEHGRNVRFFARWKKHRARETDSEDTTEETQKRDRFWKNEAHPSRRRFNYSPFNAS